MRLPLRRSLVGLALAVSTVIGASTTLAHGGPARGYADPSTPPAPPVFIPTPIGQPPSPPTPSPTITPVPTAAAAVTPGPAAATTGASVVATVAASPTVKPAAEVAFTVDAVRVSKVNNPGNLQGLASVKRGANVWLMVYFTVSQLPGQVNRLATYSILNNGRTVYKVIYKSKQKATEVGRFSRYVSYRIPSTLPLGHYTFHAVLQLRKVLHSKSWRFVVGTRTRVATARTRD